MIKPEEEATYADKFKNSYSAGYGTIVVSTSPHLSLTGYLANAPVLRGPGRH